jgi:hypothetical protein
MAAPTLLDYAQSTWTGTATGSEVTSDLDWAASGDAVLCLGATEDNTRTLNTPTATGLTFAALTGLPTNTASSAKVYGWKATASGNGNSVVTATGDGSNAARGIAAWAWSGSDGIENPVVNVGTGLTVNVTVQQADSTVCMVLADWNATADVTVTTTPAGGTVRQINQVSGLVTFAVVEWTAQATGTRAYGLTAWTGTGTVSKAAVEVRGSGTSPGAVTLTPVSIALSAVEVTPVPQPVTVVLSPVSVALSAVAVTPVPQPVTVTLTPVGVSLVATPTTPVPQPVTVALTPLSLSLTAVPVSAGGVGTVTLTPVSVALSAVPVTATPLPVTVTLTPVNLALTAPPVTPVPVGGTVTLTPLVLTLTATPVNAVPGPVTVALVPALVVLSVVPLVIGQQESPGTLTSNARLTGQISATVPAATVLSSAVSALGSFTTDDRLSGGA